MVRQPAMLVCLILVLVASAGSAPGSLDLKIDVGCPGQEGAGNLKAGWVAFDGTACSGAVGPVTVTNIGGSGIDVGITVGNTSDNAYRSPGEYTGDEMGRDYVSADNSISQAECTMSMTLSNLPPGEYTLTSYHNCSDRPETMATIDAVVSGSGVVGTPVNATGAAQTSLSQNVQFEQLGKAVVQFVADGAGEVVVTFVPREQAYKWRVYLNGFELNGVDLVPRIEFESASSGDVETVSAAVIGVALKSPEDGQTYTVDYGVVGGTAAAGTDYLINTGGPMCWNHPTQCHGDTDNTGDVKGSDFLILKNSWYACDPDANYNPCADFDHDGCVKGSDFLILKDSWYQTAEANCPTGVGGTLQFNPGQTSMTIEIDIVDDGLDEEDETIVIGLSNPIGLDVQLGSITEHTYTIIDPRPYVQFDNESGYGNEDVTPASIAVSLSHAWAEAVTVDYEVTDGTATGGGVDYDLAAGTLTFDPCQTTLHIAIDIVNDSNEELPETIEITLSNPTNAKLGQTTRHTFTIYDDEQTGVIIGPDNILYRNGKAWFPMLVFTNNFEEVGGLVEPDPEELAWSLDHLEGTPFGMLDYATPIGGYDYTEQLADQCYLRGVPWALSLKDLYVPDASGWPRWEERARFFPGQTPLEVARELARRLRNHPALTMYYTNDELGSSWHAQLLAMQNMLHQEDPSHPTLHQHNEDRVLEQADCYDIYAHQFYNGGVRQVARNFEIMTVISEKVSPIAPFWGCLWLADTRLRTMMYGCIANGGRGLLFYALHRMRDSDEFRDRPEAFEQRWAEIVEIGREVESRMPILLQPLADSQCTTSAADVAVRTVRGELGTWLLVVNADENNTRDITINLPPSVIEAFGDGTTFVVNNHEIEVHLAPYDVWLIRLIEEN